MKVEFEISDSEIKEAIIRKVAEDFVYRWDTQQVRDEILKKVDWSKMAPHIQEAILKMAAGKLFGENERNHLK